MDIGGYSSILFTGYTGFLGKPLLERFNRGNLTSKPVLVDRQPICHEMEWIALDSRVANEEIIISGRNTGLVNNPINIEDATEASYWLIQQGKIGIYNLASKEQISYQSLVIPAANLLHKEPIYKYSNEEDKQHKQLIGSIDKLTPLFAFSPLTP